MYICMFLSMKKQFSMMCNIKPVRRLLGIAFLEINLVPTREVEIFISHVILLYCLDNFSEY